MGAQAEILRAHRAGPIGAHNILTAGVTNAACFRAADGADKLRIAVARGLAVGFSAAFADSRIRTGGTAAEMAVGLLCAAFHADTRSIGFMGASRAAAANAVFYANEKNKDLGKK